MADERATTAFLDDFIRADEDPLAGPTGTEWARTDTTLWNHLELISNNATHGKPGGTSASSTWKKRSYSGDDCEIWGITEGGGANGIAWGLGFFDAYGTANNARGYRWRREVSSSGGSWSLRRWNGGGGSTAIGSVLNTSGFTGGAHIMMMRRRGNNIQCWYSSSVATPNFVKIYDVTDTTYMNNMYLTLTITDNSNFQILGWDAFGGGPRPRNTTYPQIIRRTPRLNQYGGSGRIWTP